jgi:hypothetical protein
MIYRIFDLINFGMQQISLRPTYLARSMFCLLLVTYPNPWSRGTRDTSTLTTCARSNAAVWGLESE